MTLLAAAGTVTVGIPVLSFFLGAIIPLLVAIVTKTSASSGVKAIANVALCILTGVIQHLLAAGGSSTWVDITQAAIAAFVASVTSYHSFWRPTGVAPALAQSTASVGIG